MSPVGTNATARRFMVSHFVKSVRQYSTTTARIAPSWMMISNDLRNAESGM